MVNIQHFYFPSTDGTTQLHGCRWLPADGEVRAVIQLVHGVSEYIDRYDRFARFLAEHGFLVVGHDHLGHGASLPRGGTPIYFGAKNGWQLAAEDVYTLTRQLHDAYPQLPRFILGHSMGSFLVRTLLIQHPGCVSGAIIMGSGWNSSAAISGGKMVTVLTGACRGRQAVSTLVIRLAFGGYNRAFAPNRTPFDWIAVDEQAVDRYIADPLCGQDGTIGLFSDMLNGFRFVQSRKNIEKMEKTTPILLISGADDPVGHMGRGVEQIRSMFLRADMQDVSMVLLPGLRHEILNEGCAPQEVYPMLADWLCHRLVQPSPVSI